MPAYNNSNFNGNMSNGMSFNSYNNNYNYGLTPQEIVQYFQQGRLIWSDYVHGRAGADSYQLPPGINMVRLWDDEQNRFYVKGYDNNGRPRVLDDNDFTEHIEPEPVNPANIDLSQYATKEDIQNIIANLLNQGYVTQAEFNNALSRLAVGNGGRIVMNNEQNA